MSLEVIVNQHYNKLNENERVILKQILSDKTTYQDMTINELAKATLTSKSTIHRLSKKLGFSGYSEFKFKCQEDVQSQYIFLNQDPKKRLFEIVQQDSEETLKLFKQTYTPEIVEIMKQANRIFLYGTGWGQNDVLAYLRRSFVTVGQFPILIQASKELDLAVSGNYIKKDDLLIVLSLSGKIENERDNLKKIQLKEIPIISMTNFGSNPLARLATYNLYFQSTPTPFRQDEIYSFAPVYLMADMLYRKYLENYLEEMEEIL